MLGRTDSRLRMVAVLVAFAVIGVAATARLGYWQVVASEELSAQIAAVKAETASANAQPVTRADIVDRDGAVMAKTSSFDKLVAYPDVIDPEDLESSVDLLTALLDLSSRERLEYTQTLSESIDQGKQFVTLHRGLAWEQSADVQAAIGDKLLPGFGLTSESLRNYPLKGGEPGTSLASHVLGFVRADDTGGQGIERYYDDRLTTVDPASVDVASISALPLDLEGLQPEPLWLTIDAKLQRALEKDLHAINTANRAKSVSAIVMEPKTGAIIAAASVPAYHSEQYASIAKDDEGRLRNRVFQDAFEPGSVMKIFTATAALDHGVVTPNTVITDQKKLEFWKYTVRNADHQSMGNLKVKDVIAYSRNVATAKIARRLGHSTDKAAERLYGLWDKLGMPGPTGAGVTGEAKGIWYDPDAYQWAPVDLANRAFGQGVSVTLPQLARGLSAIVNGGFKVQPYLANDTAEAAVEPVRVLKAKTANQAKDILRQVTGAVPWYAEGSLIPGYDIGGKTGTAQIWDSKQSQWKKKRFNHSFVGFVGGRKQEYVIAVRLEEPRPLKVKQGLIPLRIESYEAFQTVARTVISKLKMKKSRDPNAGRPIIGTAAAKALDPVRNRQAQQAAKSQRSSEQKQARKPSAKSESGSAGRNAATDEPPAAGRGT